MQPINSEIHYHTMFSLILTFTFWKEENNLKSSKLSAASFLCEELQIKFKEKSDYCSKIESSLDELKEEVGSNI